jgi:hypothetical protein
MPFLVFRIPDNGQSPETQSFWVLYTIVRAIYILQEGTASVCLNDFKTADYWNDHLIHDFFEKYVRWIMKRVFYINEFIKVHISYGS